MTQPGDRCVVCTGPTTHHAEGVVLRSRPVTYLRCTECGLVAARSPDWLDQAYSDAITTLDVGLLDRCLQISRVAATVLRAERLGDGTFLDWAGGYGTLTRLMRDRGFDFRHHDPYCENLFARDLEGSLDRRYDLVTAIEVLEHLVDPVSALRPVAATTDRLLVTTLLLPSPPPQPGEWWYYTPETGQHVTFFTRRALRALGRRLDMQLLSLNDTVHLFHRGTVSARTRLLLRKPRLAEVLGTLGGLRAHRSLQAHDLAEALS